MHVGHQFPTHLAMELAQCQSRQCRAARQGSKAGSKRKPPAQLNVEAPQGGQVGRCHKHTGRQQRTCSQPERLQLPAGHQGIQHKRPQIALLQFQLAQVHPVPQCAYQHLRGWAASGVGWAVMVGCGGHVLAS